ncbi:hypothetical protein PCE1_002849 [Barthelona sp. PCE]
MTNVVDLITCGPSIREISGLNPRKLIFGAHQVIFQDSDHNTDFDDDLPDGTRGDIDYLSYSPLASINNKHETQQFCEYLNSQSAQQSVGHVSILNRQFVSDTTQQLYGMLSNGEIFCGSTVFFDFQSVNPKDMLFFNMLLAVDDRTLANCNASAISDLLPRNLIAKQNVQLTRYLKYFKPQYTTAFITLAVFVYYFQSTNLCKSQFDLFCSLLGFGEIRPKTKVFAVVYNLLPFIMLVLFNSLFNQSNINHFNCHAITYITANHHKRERTATEREFRYRIMERIRKTAHLNMYKTKLHRIIPVTSEVDYSSFLEDISYRSIKNMFKTSRNYALKKFYTYMKRYTSFDNMFYSFYRQHLDYVEGFDLLVASERLKLPVHYALSNSVIFQIFQLLDEDLCCITPIDTFLRVSEQNLDFNTMESQEASVYPILAKQIAEYVGLSAVFSHGFVLTKNSSFLSTKKKKEKKKRIDKVISLRQAKLKQKKLNSVLKHVEKIREESLIDTSKLRLYAPQLKSHSLPTRLLTLIRSSNGEIDIE